MKASERSPWIVTTLTICLWVIWDEWAAFFVWLTQFSTLSNPSIVVGFFQIYGAGKLWLSGAYVNPLVNAFTYTSIYPPASLPFFGFFAQFDFGYAALLWTRLGLTVFSVALLSATSLFKHDKYLFLSITGLLFFTSFGLRIELQLGQADLLLAGLTALSLVAHRSRHSRTSAALLAIATLLKGSPALFLLYFVVFYRDLRYLLYFLESSAAIFGLSLLVIPIRLYWIWMVKISSVLLASTMLLTKQSTMVAAPSGEFSYFTLIASASLICAFVAFAYRVYPISIKKHASPPSAVNDAMFLMNTFIMVLLFTRGWPQDYVWVLLPIALFLSELLVDGVKTAYFVAVALAAFLINIDVYPVFTYFYYYYYYYPQIALINYDWYYSILAGVPTGLVASLIMLPALILLFTRPGSILRKRRNIYLFHNSSAR